MKTLTKRVKYHLDKATWYFEGSSGVDVKVLTKACEYLDTQLFSEEKIEKHLDKLFDEDNYFSKDTPTLHLAKTIADPIAQERVARYWNISPSVTFCITPSKIKEEFFKNLRIDIDITDYVDVNEVFSFDELYDALEDADAFKQEIIYFDIAIQYLSYHDPTLAESLEIARGLGFEIGDIRSELLASLLKSQRVKEQINRLSSKIDNFLRRY